MVGVEPGIFKGGGGAFAIGWYCKMFGRFPLNNIEHPPPPPPPPPTHTQTQTHRKRLMTSPLGVYNIVFRLPSALVTSLTKPRTMDIS